ncbi:hypothetical protein GF396_04515 [Candidatus Pacearchaeota archaeon]|nr:hypothetical protein [Candidatus Pacearchaeota archaeon]
MALGSVSLTGADIININGRIFKDLADGDCVNLEFPNNLVEAKTGKNGNTIFAFNATGQLVTVTVRLIRGSADDKFLNNQLSIYRQDPARFVLFDGEFTKRAGDGQGSVTDDVYKVGAGLVQKIPATKENQEGDTEQAVSVYQLVFANTDRLLT